MKKKRDEATAEAIEIGGLSVGGLIIGGPIGAGIGAGAGYALSKIRPRKNKKKGDF
ncbi:MAG: hypothetical protein QXR60_03775 [Candidatus Nanoarchaeia archaeon]